MEITAPTTWPIIGSAIEISLESSIRETFLPARDLQVMTGDFWSDGLIGETDSSK